MRLRSLFELKYKKPDPKDTLGIKRADMPQVKSSDYPEFMEYLEKNGARFTTEKDIPAKDLKPVQSEFSDAGIERQRAKTGPRKPVIASSDNYIIDGHHRWLVALNYDDTVDIIRINMPVRELLKLTLEFPKTYYKDIYTEGYKLQLERDKDMYILHIKDMESGKRTEVRGKSGYESGGYDPTDKLHKLLDKIGKAANISELINGEPVGINPNHPDGKKAKKDTDDAFNEDVEQKPHLYLDMDGVQADFFGAWAKWYGDKTGKQISSYRDIGDAEAQLASIMELTNQGPEFVEKFFANLEPLQGFASVLNWIQQNNISYSILSAPLRGNNEASIKGKKAWLAKHNPGGQQEIFTGRKESYAMNKQTQQPNVLIDDHGKYIDRWQSKGGIAIKHTDRNPQATINQLEKIYNKDVTEDSPYSWAKRKLGHLAYADQYKRAAKKLHEILTRKYKETDGHLRHSLGYYAHMLSRQTGEKLNWKELEAEYLDTFGNMYFEEINERLIKLDPKGPKNLKKLSKKSKYQKRKEMLAQLDDLDERKLSKKEIKKRDKIADELPDKEFKKRYGKDWEAVKYGTATNLAKESINEGRDANLYHETDEDGIIGILSSGDIKPKNIYTDREAGEETEIGPRISLTRDFELGLGDFKLIIDQTKLAQTHKITPYTPEEMRDEVENEAEEYVQKSIPLSYVKAIHLEFDDDATDELKQLAKRAGIPLVTGDRRNPEIIENFADGKVKGKSRPGRVKRSGASCKGSVTELRRKAKKYSGERAKMYHWCANMKSGKKKK